MIYYITAATLFILILIYFEVADYFNIIDKPNARSSHKGNVIRGGGVIFVFAVWMAMFYLKRIPAFFLGGFSLLAIISFVDDKLNIGTKVRMSSQFIAVFLLLFEFRYFEIPLLAIPLISVFCVAAINAYNFMDGINGLNGMYSLSVLISLFWINLHESFVESLLLKFLIIAIFVFGYFNFRKKAVCFSGDVGSITMAFVLLFLIGTLIFKTQNYSFILLLLLYGVDAFWTVVQRVLRKEKITEAHRLHLYQLLANELKVPHLMVSFMYLCLQLIISFLVIENHLSAFISPLLLAIYITTFISILYVYLKTRIMSSTYGNKV